MNNPTPAGTGTLRRYALHVVLVSIFLIIAGRAFGQPSPSPERVIQQLASSSETAAHDSRAVRRCWRTEF